MKKYIVSFLMSLMVSGTALAQDMEIIVTGSATGSTNAIAQLIAKDSKTGKFGDINLDAVAPGNACKGYALVTKQGDKPFITHYENFYQLVAKLKNDPACPYVSFENADPIVSKVQGLYLVVKTNDKRKSLEDFSKQKLKIGYSGDSEVERGWHAQQVKHFGVDHTFVGYNGSSSLREGLASEEVDAVWTTYGHFLRLKKVKDEYAIIMRTMTELNVDAPVLAEHFNDQTLTRAFLGTWYVFNDKTGIANAIAAALEQDHKNNTGEFGKYANDKKLILTFDAKTQLEMEKNLSWAQY
jgi:flavodoxin